MGVLYVRYVVAPADMWSFLGPKLSDQTEFDYNMSGMSPPLPPPSRTNWTRLIAPSVLTGHVSSQAARPRWATGCAASSKTSTTMTPSSLASRSPPRPARSSLQSTFGGGGVLLTFGVADM